MKVLIVDDSVVFRTFMRNCLSGLPDVKVVGTASDGQEALQLIDRLKPDLITLDMEMPNLGGLEVLEVMRLKFPRVKVVVVTCATETDAKKTVKALELGAFDFILKPEPKEDNPKKYLQDLLEPLLKQARSLRSVLGLKTNTGTQTVALSTKKNISERSPKIINAGKKFAPDVIAIGSSTGGPAALHKVLEGLPASFSVPIVVTQHMPRLFLESLADRLDKGTKLNCSVAKDDETLQAGHVYIAPGDVHMKIKSKGISLVVKLDAGERVNHAIPAVDVTYESLVALAPRVRTLALILTGMGNDGAKGAKLLADKSNYIMIQDKESSVVWGMAGEAFALGAVNEVLPLNQIHESLIFHTMGNR